MEKLNKQIREVYSDINRLSNALYAMESTDIRRYPDNYEVLSTEAALRGEKIACALRRLVYYTDNANTTGYLKAAGDEMGIRIQYQNDVMEITLPSLLPKRRQQGNRDFILDPLRSVLEKYIETNPAPKYKECVVCFSHIYGRDMPTTRDYDNLELKQILDVIISRFMVDDNGILCDVHHTTELGEHNCTRISIMSKCNFSAWLEMNKTSLFLPAEH